MQHTSTLTSLIVTLENESKQNHRCQVAVLKARRLIHRSSLASQVWILGQARLVRPLGLARVRSTGLGKKVWQVCWVTLGKVSLVRLDEAIHLSKEESRKERFFFALHFFSFFVFLAMSILIFQIQNQQCSIMYFACRQSGILWKAYLRPCVKYQLYIAFFFLNSPLLGQQV